MSVKGHVVAVELAFWGHLKPLCALLSRLVQIKPTYVTLFTLVAVRDKAIAEFDRLFIDAGVEHLKSLVRVVGLPIRDDPLDTDNTFKSAYASAYQELYSEKPIPILPDGESLPVVPKPQLVIVDSLLYDVMNLTRSISGKSDPVYAWQTTSAAAVLLLFGPEKFGGLDDLAAKIGKITETDQEARMKAIGDLFCRNEGKILKLTGIPPMYDYELKPQQSAHPMSQAGMAIVCKDYFKFLTESDAVITHTNNTLEEGPIEDLEKWLGKDKCLQLGPLSPLVSDVELKKEKESSPIAVEVEAFLEDALQKYGPNSVIYISFGTFWWPADSHKIQVLVDVLIEQNIPFLFSHASPVAVVEDEIKSKIKDSKLGYLASWLPQQTILRHKACGWFITHGGQNSYQESLAEGVPLIFWPYDTDQPINSLNITSVHNAGYELFEVRTGLGLKPIHRLGDKTPLGTPESLKSELIDVFTKARGEDGKAKREKAEWFKEQLRKTWEEGGYSRNQLQKISNLLE